MAGTKLGAATFRKKRGLAGQTTDTTHNKVDPHANKEYFHDRLPLMPDEEDQRTYKSLYVNINRMRQRPDRTVMHVKVTGVVSPHLFYIEPEDVGVHKSLGKFKDWKEALQAYYSDPRYVTHLEVKTEIIPRYRCYVHLDPTTNTWERVRAMRYCIKTQRVEVYFFEWHKFVIVHRSSLREMHPRFTKWSCVSAVAHLINIEPTDGENFWPVDAVKYFKSLVEGKWFYCTVSSQSAVEFPNRYPDVDHYFGVTMKLRNPAGHLTLQQEMVKAGFAVPTGILAAIKDTVVPKVQQARFDLGEYEKMTPEDILPVNCNATLPTTAELKERFTLKQDELPVLDLFGNLRVGPQFIHDPEGHIVEKKDLDKRQLPDLFKKSLVGINFCHFFSPDVMYMHLLGSTQELHYMEAVLSAAVNDLPSVCKEEAVPGTFVACTLKVDDKRTNTWARAVVKQATPGSQYVKLILIDYGSEMTQYYGLVRPLPPFFQTIPGFAIRIHYDSAFVIPSVQWLLSFVTPVKRWVRGLESPQFLCDIYFMNLSTTKYWTSDASKTLGKFIRHWEEKEPVYFAWRHNTSRTIGLEYFGQRTVFDSSASAPGWRACDVSISTTSTETSLSQLRDHILLRNLFYSIGIDVAYELGPFEEDNNEFRFDTLGEVLFRCGFCNRILPPKSDREQHEAITEATIQPEYVKKQKAMGGEESHFETWGTIQAIVPKE